MHSVYNTRTMSSEKLCELRECYIVVLDFFFLGDSTAMENDIDNFIQHDEVRKKKRISIEVISTFIRYMLATITTTTTITLITVLQLHFKCVNMV